VTVSNPDPNLRRAVEGYMVNTGLSVAAADQVGEIQRQLATVEPGLLWLPPAIALHVTLLDWIAPLVEYEESHLVLFERVRSTFGTCLRRLLEHRPPIDVRFTRIVVGPDAIILTGSDDGSFAEIRDAFVAGVQLHPQTKRPPKIIHMSIARYLRTSPIEAVARAAAGIDVDLTERMSTFRLVRENRVPMLDFDLLDIYRLQARAAEAS
jgi:hypothetical protein